MFEPKFGKSFGIGRLELARGLTLSVGVAGHHLVDGGRVVEQARSACSSSTRIIVTLSVTCASLGSVSQNWRPSVFVLIGLKTLFTLSGTFSSGSQRSRWLGAALEVDT